MRTFSQDRWELRFYADFILKAKTGSCDFSQYLHKVCILMELEFNNNDNALSKIRNY